MQQQQLVGAQPVGEAEQLGEVADRRARRGRARRLAGHLRVAARRRTSPQAIFTSVDLPAPFGPSSPTSSPGWTSRSTPASATVAAVALGQLCGSEGGRHAPQCRKGPCSCSTRCAPTAARSRATHAASRSTWTPGRSRRRQVPRRAPPGGADHLLQLDAINFGSGWFPTLRKRPGLSGYRTVEAALGEHGPWDNDELRASTRRPSPRCSARTGPPADAPVRRGAARAGPIPGRPHAPWTWSSRRAAPPSGWRSCSPAACASSTTAASTSAPRSCRATWRWRALAEFGDLDSADDLRRQPRAARAARGRRAALRPRAGRAHRRAASCCRRGAPSARSGPARCTPASSSPSAPACPPRLLDIRLWNRGQAPEYKAIPRHRTRSVYY